MELEVTWGRAVRVWFAFLWRNLIMIVCAMILGAVLGFVIGFIMSAFDVSSETINRTVVPISAVLGLALSVIPIRLILGKDFGLTQFGVNLVELPPGTWSSQRHWHSREDEFVYVLVGHPTLVTDAGEQQLAPGMCIGFAADRSDGHHLINKSDAPAHILEVGSRIPEDDCYYADIDMKIEKRGHGGRFTTRNGTPYES